MRLRTSGARLLTSDRVSLAGRRWEAESARAAVVLVHGFAATCEHPPVVAVAEALHEHGLDVIAYDARGHGRSGGSCTLGDLEEHDVAAAVEIARERCDQVLVVGASMGAIAAVRYAASEHAENGLTGVVAVSCPARWRLPRNARAILAAGLTRTRLGRLLARRHLRVRLSSTWVTPEPPVELVEHVHVPIAFVHGERDRFLPPGDVYELFAASNDARHVEMVPAMGHAYDVAAVPAIVRAVDWVLEEQLALEQLPA